MKHFKTFFAFLFLISFAAEARLPDMIPYRKGKVWGYCDSTKKILIEPKFTSVSLFDGDYAVASSDNLFGIIDRSGNTILPFRYAWLEQTDSNKYYIVCDAKERYGLISLKGDTIIPVEYTWISSVSPEYFACTKGKNMNLFHCNGKLVFSLKNSDWEMSPEYIPESGAFIVYNKDNRGVIDTNGIIKIPFDYYSVEFTLCKEYECFGKRKQDYFTSGFQRLPEDHAECSKKYPRLRYVSISKLENDKSKKRLYGWYDNELKKYAVSPRYEYTGYFHQGYALFCEEGKYGFVDTNFRQVIEARYSNVSNFQPSGLAWVSEFESKQKKWNTYRLIGYLDTHGTEYWED